MAKGFFTQGAAVLTSRAVPLDEVEALLRAFRIVSRNAGAAPDLSGPALIIGFRPEVNGYVTVDVQSRPWPDHMGDPKTEVDLFGAWSTGQFGPFAFPGSLQRAAEQSWSWSEGKSIPAAHRAFIRIRLSYLFGANDDALVMPEDCDPVAELDLSTKLARALLDHPAALAYFNPNGEVLCNRETIDGVRERCPSPHLLAVNLWCNIRLFNVPGNWLVMDSVGMQQVDRRDSEACFRAGAYQPGDVDRFLRNVGNYLLEKGEVIANGNTIDGPGGVRWKARLVDDALVSPPRPVLRWFPSDGSKPPAALA